MKRCVAVVLSWALVMVAAGPLVQAGEPVGLKPENTFAVVVGVLEFGDPGMSGWSKDKRKDQELYDTLRKLGVPNEQMRLLLDADATAANMSSAVKEIAKAAPTGSTLIFYYAGHGVRPPDGKTYLANYDIAGGNAAGTGFPVLSLIDLITQGFKGKHVLLLADCCYSGTLGQVAKALGEAGFKAAAVTSADASNTSTDNWTFSMTVIDTLRGNTLADRDGDNIVTVGEMGLEVLDSMKFLEGQKAGLAICGMPESFRLVAAAPGKSRSKCPAELKVGEFAREAARQKGGRIIDCSKEGYTLEVWSYNDKTTAKREHKALKPFRYQRHPKDADLQVTWGGQSYRAKVVRTDGDFHLVTYPGWPAYWDEWVLSNRILGKWKPAVTGKPDPTQPEGQAKQVQVEWNGSWYPAFVLEEKDGRFFIGYVGYGSHWNEWVGSDRIKFLDDE